MTEHPLIAAAWLQADYRAALERAGARILELTATDHLPEAIERCDGLMLTGGVDVDPAEYGATERHDTVETDADRDAYELALARIALARDLPVLAICRGAQVLNVAAGGTLVQDIPSALSDTLPHQQPEATAEMAHEVIVSPGTCLAVLFDRQSDARQRDDAHRLAVNSRHHQSVKDVAPGFVVSATAPDGIVEAIEKPSANFCLGVQWHPENYWQTGEFRQLFEGLVSAAKRYRLSRHR